MLMVTLMVGTREARRHLFQQVACLFCFPHYTAFSSEVSIKCDTIDIPMRRPFKWTKPVFCFHGCFKPNAFGFRCAMTSSSSALALFSALADRRTRPKCSHRLLKYISFMVSNQWFANCSGRYLNWFAQFFTGHRIRVCQVLLGE